MSRTRSLSVRSHNGVGGPRKTEGRATKYFESECVVPLVRFRPKHNLTSKPGTAYTPRRAEGWICSTCATAPWSAHSSPRLRRASSTSCASSTREPSHELKQFSFQGLIPLQSHERFAQQLFEREFLDERVRSVLSQR